MAAIFGQFPANFRFSGALVTNLMGIGRLGDIERKGQNTCTDLLDNGRLRDMDMKGQNTVTDIMQPSRVLITAVTQTQRRGFT